MKCPQCGYVTTPSKVAQRDVTWPDTMNTAHMTDTELRAYCKRTSYAFDIAFVRHIRPDLLTQLGGLPDTKAGSRQAFDLARMIPSPHTKAK